MQTLELSHRRFKQSARVPKQNKKGRRAYFGLRTNATASKGNVACSDINRLPVNSCLRKETASTACVCLLRSSIQRRVQPALQENGRPRRHRHGRKASATCLDTLPGCWRMAPKIKTRATVFNTQATAAKRSPIYQM